MASGPIPASLLRGLRMDKRGSILLHPKSFFELVIAGFSLVAVPLIVALVSGAFYVGRLSDQSQEAVYRAVQATQKSRVLLEQITTMERSIRQYLVLGDEALYQNYLDRHRIYEATAENLEQLLLDDTLKRKLRQLNAKEGALYARLRQRPGGEGGALEQAFIALTETAQSLLQDSNRLIDSEVEILRDMSSQAQEIIFWELLAVIPGAVIFIVLFTVLIARPIRQIDSAIRQLGDGQFEREISVSGPRDLEYLGRRLNWLRERLNELEEKKSKFLRYVSHELKTPLTAVREGAELLAEGVAGPLNESQQEVTHILQKNSVSLQKMIEKLLSFSLPDAAPSSSGITAVKLHQLVDNVVADHKPAIMAKGIALELECGEATLTGDTEQIRVVVDNLLSNAVKYSPSGGSIKLKLQQTPDTVVLEVQDSGPGIDPSDKTKVFDEFYRGNRVRKGNIHGSGLGLSIAREFVKAHKGNIEVVDQSAGAHFRVTLPIGTTQDTPWIAS